MFTATSIKFLQNLSKNNDRDWFAANKKVYEQEIKNPAKFFADVMAGEFENLTGHSHKPKIFRIFRDVRFSKDKTPYNIYQRISWVPRGTSANAPGWFFGLETDHVVIGTGMFQFDKEGLQRWRQFIDSAKGEKFADILNTLEKSGVRISGPDLKRVPSGYDKEHPREALLRHKGLSVWIDYPDAKILFGENYAENLMTDFKRVKPVYDSVLALA